MGLVDRTAEIVGVGGVDCDGGEPQGMRTQESKGLRGRSKRNLSHLTSVLRASSG